MFYYFPKNFVWSSAFMLALMGGQLNQMDRWLAPLRDTGPEPDPDAWTKAWDSMGEEQSRHAGKNARTVSCTRPARATSAPPPTT